MLEKAENSKHDVDDDDGGVGSGGGDEDSEGKGQGAWEHSEQDGRNTN